MESTLSHTSIAPGEAVGTMIEQGHIYGCGDTGVMALVSNGTLYLRQDSNRGHHALIQIATLTGLVQLEQLLQEAKQQLLARH